VLEVLEPVTWPAASSQVVTFTREADEFDRAPQAAQPSEQLLSLRDRAAPVFLSVQE
jgi:hypothetical protein